MSSFRLALACVLAVLVSNLPAQSSKPPAVEDAKLGATKNVHVAGNLYLAGQPTQADIDVIAKAGIKRVITLRRPGEVKWDEKGAFEARKIGFTTIAVGKPDTLTDDIFDSVRRELRRSGKAMLHCKSANRVGGVWLAYRVLDQGVPIEKAVAEAKTVGMRTAGFEIKARDYIRRTLARTDGQRSVKPGINDSFTDPDMVVEKYVRRFEVESREVFRSRKAIVAACELKPGERIADIGAGTGLFTDSFSRAVGSDGWVWAVDIVPKFIGRINEIAVKEKLDNVTGVVCTETSATLPPACADVAFICDTYHHFEFPALTMASIHKALAPGGRLVLVDFERIPGKSRPWILGHVRAGKEVFRAEIEKSGFKFVKERKVDGLRENYCLVFRKE